MSLAQPQKRQKPPRLVSKTRRPPLARRASVVLILGLLAVVALPVAVGLGGTTRLPSARPLGIDGRWSMVFDDEFNGTSLNTQLWRTDNDWVNQNHVTAHARNATVADGDLILRLASRSSGAQIQTRGFRFAVGEFAEARIEFAGNGSTVFNWPAWWSAGPKWPAAGESDIAEGLGDLTVNYHSPTGVHNHGTVKGTWTNGFHTYGIYRGPNYCDVYWDGKLVKRYATDDDGKRQTLILTLGAANKIVTGTSSDMRVSYVRVWSKTADATLSR